MRALDVAAPALGATSLDGADVQAMGVEGLQRGGAGIEVWLVPGGGSEGGSRRCLEATLRLLTFMPAPPIVVCEC